MSSRVSISRPPLRTVAWAAIVPLAGLAWYLTVRQAAGMSGTAAMDAANTGSMALGLSAFLAMWISMMAAMMLPSVAPAAGLWVRSMSAQGSGAVRARRLAAFVAGYLLAWSAAGVVAFGAQAVLLHLANLEPGAARWLGAGVLAVAGLYQLTPAKEACLRRCRSPIGSFLHSAGLRGPAVDLRVGLSQGGWCAGCCWALMSILLVVGVMNLAAMAALAIVVGLEKLWPDGRRIRRAVGVATLGAAALAPFVPGFLPGFPSGGMGM